MLNKNPKTKKQASSLPSVNVEIMAYIFPTHSKNEVNSIKIDHKNSILAQIWIYSQSRLSRSQVFRRRAHTCKQNRTTYKHTTHFPMCLRQPIRGKRNFEGKWTTPHSETFSWILWLLQSYTYKRCQQDPPFSWRNIPISRSEWSATVSSLIYSREVKIYRRDFCMEKNQHFVSFILSRFLWISFQSILKLKCSVNFQCVFFF